MSIRGGVPITQIAGRRSARRLQSLFICFASIERERRHLEDEALGLYTACYTTAELDEIDGTATRI